MAFIAVNSVTSVVHSLSQKEGDSGLRHRLLWKLLAIHVLLIAFVILLVWLAVDYLAAGYLAALMKEYNVSPTTTHRMFIHAVHRYLIWASLAALGLAVTSSFLLLRKVLSPLTRMMDITKKIARGDYAAKVPIESRDEVGQLARAFNQMAESLGKVEQLRKTMVLDVAHELRTPLTNMKGYLEALLDGVLPPSRQNLELLQEETGRLVRLVEDLLRLAKADAARATLHKSPVPIRELIARELDSFLPRFQARQISVETHFHPAVDRIGGDSDKLAQVVGNLLRERLALHSPGRHCPGLHGTLRCGSEDCFLKPGERDFRKRPSLHFRTFLPRRKIALPGPRRRGDRPGHRERAGRSARRAGGRGDSRRRNPHLVFPSSLKSSTIRFSVTSGV